MNRQFIEFKALMSIKLKQQTSRRPAESVKAMDLQLRYPYVTGHHEAAAVPRRTHQPLMTSCNAPCFTSRVSDHQPWRQQRLHSVRCSKTTREIEKLLTRRSCRDEYERPPGTEVSPIAASNTRRCGQMIRRRQKVGSDDVKLTNDRCAGEVIGPASSSEKQHHHHHHQQQQQQQQLAPIVEM